MSNLQLLDRYYRETDPRKRTISEAATHLSATIGWLRQLTQYYPQPVVEKTGEGFETFAWNQWRHTARFIDNPTNLNDPRYANQVKNAQEQLRAIKLHAEQVRRHHKQ